MSFGLTPRQHLDNLIEEHNFFRKNLASIRIGVNCCVWANHLPEIVFAVHHAAASGKVYNTTKEKKYREHVITMHPDLGIIRDLCDYAKHGPNISRQTVKTQNANQHTTLEVSSLFAAGIPHHDEVDRIVVTMKDTTEKWLDVLIEEAIKFWEKEFATHSL